MSAETLVNGRAGPIDPSDRGLAYGDGLFETMAARDGVIRWLDYHLERLAGGCARLALPPPEPALREEILRVAARPGRHVVKAILTRGPGARGYAPPAVSQPTRIVSISSWPAYPAANYTRGIGLQTLSLRLGENPALAGLKHLNRLEQVLAKLELGAHASREGLLLDGRGAVVGGVSSNLFAVRGAELVTPALERCGVKGVMRRVVLETASRVGLKASERELVTADLASADELFVTNAVFGIWPVIELDTHPVARGAATLRLMQRLGVDPGA